MPYFAKPSHTPARPAARRSLTRHVPGKSVNGVFAGAIMVLAMVSVACSSPGADELLADTAEAIVTGADGGSEQDGGDGGGEQDGGGKEERGEQDGGDGDAALDPSDPYSIPPDEWLVLPESEPSSTPSSIVVSGVVDAPVDNVVEKLEVMPGRAFAIATSGDCETPDGDPVIVEVVSGENDYLRLSGCEEYGRFEVDHGGSVTLDVSAGPAGFSGTYEFTVVAATDPDVIALEPGDVVGLDKPILGAGNIEGMGQRDLYSFEATAGVVYSIEQLGCELSGTEQLGIEVVGAGLAESAMFLVPEDDCAVVTRLAPNRDGTVTVTIESRNRDGMGTYGFRFSASSSSGALELRSGDIVGPSNPAPADGTIEAVGERDHFRYGVRAGESFVVEQLGDCIMSLDGDSWTLSVDGAGIAAESIFNSFDEGDCTTIDRFDATGNGVVELTMAASDDRSVGTYSFRVNDVTDPPPIELESGSVVAPGTPASGAGLIDSWGERDLYSIEAEEGQWIAIEQLGGCDIEGDDALHLTVTGAGIDEEENVLRFDAVSDGDCDNIDPFVITRDGPVSLVMGHRHNEAIGTYSFRVTVIDSRDAYRSLLLRDFDQTETDEGTLVTVSEELLFDFGSAELRPEAGLAIGRIAELIGLSGDDEILIIGHTDSVGTDEANLALSSDRADAVINALVEAGVDRESLVGEGRGESQPVADNANSDGTDNPDGRAANRRVEVLFDSLD